MKNKDRENHYTWVIPMFSVEVALHKLKARKDIVINSLNDAKKYKIGVLREAAMHQMLRRNGFADGQQLQAVSSNDKNVQKLFLHRIDLDADNSLVIAWEAKRLGLAANKVQKLLPLFETPVYMAVSKQTKPELIKRLRTAFQQLQTEGKIAAILDKAKKDSCIEGAK